MEQERYYVLFPSHTEGIKMEALLKDEKVKYTIVPTPRELSKCCGIAIMYNKQDEEKIQKLIDIHNVKTLGLHTVKKKIVNPYL